MKHTSIAIFSIVTVLFFISIRLLFLFDFEMVPFFETTSQPLG